MAVHRRACDQQRSRRFCSLLRDNGGSAYVILVSALIPILSLVGGAADLGAAYMADARLQSAVDAATLAGVRAKQLDPDGANDNEKTKAAIISYLNANMAADYIGMSRAAPVISVTTSGRTIRVSTTASATVPTTLLKLVNITTLPISATASAEAGEQLPEAVETMLVLDYTGSMYSDIAGGPDRIGALRTAMSGFLDVIYGKNEDTRADFGLGVIPYNFNVNVGRLLPNSMVEQVPGFTDKAATNAYGWKGCVFADPTKKGLTNDTTIDTGTFDMGKVLPGESGMPAIKPFIYPPTRVDSFQKIQNFYKFSADASEAFSIANYSPMRTALVRQYGDNICTVSQTDTTAKQCSAGGVVYPNNLRAGSDAILTNEDSTGKSYAGKSYEDWAVPTVYNKDTKGNHFLAQSPNYVCPNEALPIQYGRTKTALKKYINTDNNPIYNVGTWHNQAMTWAYRLLERDDKFARSRPTGRPVRKVVIFMTDGNFASEDFGTVNHSGTSMKASAYTGYMSYEDKLVTDTMTEDAHIVELTKRFSKTCAAMKTDGIVIYTIAFALDNGAQGNATREMFRNCASNRNTHFFSAASGTELNNAFVTIGAELVDLHLTQ